MTWKPQNQVGVQNVWSPEKVGGASLSLMITAWNFQLEYLFYSSAASLHVQVFNSKDMQLIW